MTPRERCEINATFQHARWPDAIGNNSFAGVTGFDAGTGYDLASGWGTIDAAKFVPALARFG